MNDQRQRNWLKWIEVAGVVLVLMGLAVHLVTTYSLKAYSDPAGWYSFGRNFPSGLGSVKLAYGFPLVLAIAIKAVGPFYAFLINVPILLLLVVLLYFFARRHGTSLGGGNDMFGMLCGAGSVLIFLALNKGMLRYLSSPYRDPLSFVLILCSCLLLVRYRCDSRHPLWLAPCSALALGMACSIRETSVLMLLPLFFYAVSEKLLDKNLPFWKPMLLFACAFALACVPLAWQNLATTGSVAVPAQAARAAAKTGTIVPGIEVRHLSDIMPRTVAYLGSHYGILVWLLAAVGTVAALLSKNMLVLCLVLPAGTIYFLFYASYLKVVHRYLFVIDLFVAPLAGLGGAVILKCALKLFFRNEKFKKTASIVGFCTLILIATVVASWGSFGSGERFRLSDARKLHDNMQTVLRPGAYVLAERPLHGIIKCFSEANVKALLYLGNSRMLRDPGVMSRLKESVAENEIVYSVHYSEFYKNFIRKEFDLVPIREFSATEYGLAEQLRGTDTFFLQQIVPWSGTSSEKLISVDTPGKYVLRLDVGHLSKSPRSYTRVMLGASLLDESPMDNVNYYSVDVEETPWSATVRIESDGLVPADMSVGMHKMSEPITMNFQEDSVLNHLNRLSPTFVSIWKRKYPGITESGYVIVPTVARDSAVFVFSAEVVLGAPAGRGKQLLVTESRGKPLFKGQVGESWQRISFVADESAVTNINTRLMWRIEGAGDGEKPTCMFLKWLTVTRVEPKRIFHGDIGKTGDDYIPIQGLHRAESLPGKGCYFRWTTDRASVRVILAKDDSPARIMVGYFDENRPGPLGPTPVPQFFFNGVEFEGEVSDSEISGYKYVEAAFTVPPEVVRDEVGTLEIVTSAWVPGEHGMGKDRRRLGIMLHSITAERL